MWGYYPTLARARGGGSARTGAITRGRGHGTLPADSGPAGPGGTPRAPLHTHTRTCKSVAHTRSSSRVEGGTNQEGNGCGRTKEGGIYRGTAASRPDEGRSG